jgi:hypothetical protein
MQVPYSNIARKALVVFSVTRFNKISINAFDFNLGFIFWVEVCLSVFG